jgi:superfamily I DNA/RNA helicase
MLTGEQAETIEEPDEHKLICALPGSGKTHTFISFVDVILDKEPTNTVLMMTFINASAKEMEQRVSDRLGKQKAKRVTAATFASLMLRQFKVSLRQHSATS